MFALVFILKGKESFMTTANKKRCFTVMIIPHSEEATYSLRVPFYVLQIIVGLLVFSVVGVSVLGYAYHRAAVRAEEASTLRQINRAQQEEIDALAVETQRMLEQIQAIDEWVELVTDRLDIEDDFKKNGLQPQSFQTPSTFPEADNLGNERNYGSRSSSGGVLERAVANIALLQSVLPVHSEALEVVGEYVEKAEASPSMSPTRGRIASGFGMRQIPYSSSGYQFHTGVDLIGAYGSAIWATAQGEVTFTGYRGSFGNLVIIDHGYGYETYYAHLSGFAVTAGDYVERGQTIGYMGASGRTTGTHLHYEVHYNGSPVNPYNYMKE